jgi:primosomal protein N' (replication factor Y)
LQTHQPEHPVIRALIAQDRDAFYAAEIDAREKAHYPPFGRLASLVVSGPDRHETAGYARALARAAPQVAEPEVLEPDLLAPNANAAASNVAPAETVRVLGPADAPLSLMRGRHRLRLLVKAPRAFDLSAYLREWLANAPKKHGDIKLEVDIDPQSFL